MSDPLMEIIREQQALARRIGQTEVREAPLYATGTWTPAFGGTTTDGTITYDTQSGRYTRMGNLCFARFHINTATVTDPTGNLQISGLPFTAAAVTPHDGAAMFSDWSNLDLTAGYSRLGLRVVLSSTRATFTQSGDNIGAIFLPGAAMIGNDVEVVGMLIYEVA